MVDERLKFLAQHERGELTMVELCARFGVSRKTGYKLRERHRQLGRECLRDQSRAPHAHPNQTSAEIEAEVLDVRRKHPTWGSKKILTVLEREDCDARWPARSTIDEILKRAGVVEDRGSRRRRFPSVGPKVVANAPNDVWSADYKGWFRLGDGTRCDPLTINDVFSRYSLICAALASPKLADVKALFEASFRAHGLPKAVMTDNGPPFGSRGIGGLSRLAVWLLRLGVVPVYIEPGKPQQNGKHERFHLTLQQETAAPPSATRAAQQRAFAAFQREYNDERPHEALKMSVPGSVYERSPRKLPRKLRPHEYPNTFESRGVRKDGAITWRAEYVFLGEALGGERIGLEPVADGVLHVHLGPLVLGVLHERSGMIVPVRAAQERELPRRV